MSPFVMQDFGCGFGPIFLDLIVVGSIERLIINPIFRVLEIPLVEFNMFAPISIASAIIFYLYFVLMTKYFQQTLGKMVFGIKVIDLKSENYHGEPFFFVNGLAGLSLQQLL